MRSPAAELSETSIGYLKQIRLCAVLFGLYCCHDVLISTYNILRNAFGAGDVATTGAELIGWALYIVILGFVGVLAFWHALVMHEVIAGRRPFVDFVRDHVRFVKWTLLSIPLGFFLVIAIGIAVEVASMGR